ncbi:MAG: methylated-DNA--[protein]-cysteine S-methyltransferase [Gemmatimonadaceae bacterium]
MSVMAEVHPYRNRPANPGSGIRYTLVKSSLGYIAIARTARGLAAAFIDDDREKLEGHMRDRFPGAASMDPDDLTDRVLHAIERSSDDPGLPVDPFGTDFQKAVWTELRAIPAGSTITYSDLAARIGNPKSVRAVAAACGANPIAVIVPCHRVIGKDGSLTGYAWGMDKKRLLLEREKAGSR